MERAAQRVVSLGFLKPRRLSDDDIYIQIGQIDRNFYVQAESNLIFAAPDGSESKLIREIYPVKEGVSGIREFVFAICEKNDGQYVYRGNFDAIEFSRQFEKTK